MNILNFYSKKICFFAKKFFTKNKEYYDAVATTPIYHTLGYGEL